MDILIVSILPIQEHEISPFVLVVFNFCHRCGIVFRAQVFHLLLGRITPRYFFLFYEKVNGILAFQFQFSHSVVSDCLQPHELRHARPPYPSQLQDSTQTHVHWVGDAIQSIHTLSSPSPPALNLSHHQGFFKWVSTSHQVAKVLEFQLQHQYFQWTPRTDLL